MSSFPYRRRLGRILSRMGFAACVAMACGQALAAASACVEPGGGGIGGTGAPAHGGDGEGIGGTGAPAHGSGVGGTGTVAQGSGVGGTGATAAAETGGVGGTGIVGTVTGFASVCVNGLEVHYSPTTPVTVNGRPAGSADLAIGQVVAIDAATAANGLVARGIAVLDAVVGPISRVGANRIEVMGQSVRLSPATRLTAPGGAMAATSLQPGQWVHVGGHRDRHGAIIASRVHRSEVDERASVVGSLDRAAPGGGRVYGTSLRGLPDGLAANGQVLVAGRWDGRELHVAEAKADPDLAFAGDTRKVVIEGLVQADARRGQVRIGSFEVQIDPRSVILGGAAAELRAGREVRVAGTLVGPRNVQAERLEFEPVRGGSGHGANERRSGSDDRSGGDHADGVDHVERVEKVEHVERVERVERPEIGGGGRGGR